MTNPTYTQAAYRFYEDGTESGSTAIANQDTAITRTLTGDSNLLLRIRFQNSNAVAGATTDDYQLQRAILRPGGVSPNIGWVNVTATSNGVKGFASSNLTDQGATTNRLTGGTGSFVAGLVSEDGLADNKQITASNFTEWLFAITLVAADLGHGDVVTFRVLRNGATTGLTFTVTPQITVSKISTGFGALKDVFGGGAGSITNPVSLTGSVAVSAGDLIYVAIDEQVAVSAGTVTDDLGNTYSPINGAGTDAGNATLRAYFSVVTNPGTLTQIDIAATAGGNNYSAAALIFEGPFDSSPLDANPADTTTDVTTPFDWPATGTLAQADELIVGSLSTVTWSIGTNSNTATLQAVTGTLACTQSDATGQTTVLAVMTHVVAATTTVTLSLSSPSGTNPTQVVYNTASFKKQVAGAHDGASTQAGVGTESARATQNHWQGATLPGTSTLSARLTQNQVAAATFAGAGNLSARADKVTLAATFSGAGSLSALVNARLAAAATFAGVGDLSVEGVIPVVSTITIVSWAQVRGVEVFGTTAWQGQVRFDGAGSLSVSTTQAHQESATFAGTGALSVTVYQSIPISATFAGVSTLRAETVQNLAGAATFAGAGELRVDAVQQHAGAATFAGAGAASIDTTQVHLQGATFAGTGAFTADIVQVHVGYTNFLGAGNVSINTTQVHLQGATFTGVGNLSVLVTLQQSIAATFAGAGNLTTSADKSKTAAATFAGAGDLSVDAVQVSGGVQQSAEATFAGAGDVSVLVLQVQQAQATFNGAGALSALVVDSTTGQVTFTGVGNLSALVTQNNVAAATFAGVGSLSALVTGRLAAQATFAGAGDMSVLATQNQQIAVSFAGVGNVSINTTQRHLQGATFAGAGDVSINTTQVHMQGAVFDGTGVLRADGEIPSTAKEGAVNFAGAGSMSVLVTQNHWAQATLEGAGNLSALALDYKFAFATFAGEGSLSALANLNMPIAATFAGAGALTASATAQFAIAATFAGVGSLSAYANLNMAIAATFAGVGTLSVDATQIAALITGEATFAGVGTLSVNAQQFSSLQPDADSIDGGWTNEIDGPTLAPSIDEMVPDDVDYIKSSANPSNDVCKISLSNPQVNPAEPFVVMYRYGKTGTAQIDLGVRLLQGTTEIAAWSHPNVSEPFVTAEQTLTGGQFAAISDFGDLFLEFTADAP